MRESDLDSVEQIKKREAISKLAQSGDAKQLMKLLQKEKNMRGAAQAAAAGKPAELIGMLQRLMSTQEGTQLIENISQKARESGLADK